MQKNLRIPKKSSIFARFFGRGAFGHADVFYRQ